MDTAELISKLNAGVPGALLHRNPFGQTEQVSIWVEAEKIFPVASFLRNEPGAELDWAENVSVAQFEDTLVVTYFLRSSTTDQTLIVRTSLVPSSPESAVEAPSIASVWPMARPMEKEAGELFGIHFGGCAEHEKLPEGWHGFPLRKTYVFPQEFHGFPHHRRVKRSEEGSTDA